MDTDTTFSPAVAAFAISIIGAGVFQIHVPTGFGIIGMVALATGAAQIVNWLTNDRKD